MKRTETRNQPRNLRTAEPNCAALLEIRQRRPPESFGNRARALDTRQSPQIRQATLGLLLCNVSGIGLNDMLVSCSLEVLRLRPADLSLNEYRSPLPRAGSLNSQVSEQLFLMNRKPR